MKCVICKRDFFSENRGVDERPICSSCANKLELLQTKVINWATYLHSETMLIQVTSGLSIKYALKNLENDGGFSPDEFFALQDAIISTAEELGVLNRLINVWISIEQKEASNLQKWSRIHADGGTLPYEDMAQQDFAKGGKRHFADLANLMESNGLLPFYILR